MLRSNLLFIHVISAMGTFLALGIEGLALVQLRRTSNVSSTSAVLGTFRVVQRIAGPSMLLLLVSGLYLARTYWQMKGVWIGMGMLGLVVVGAVGGLMTGRNVRRLRKALATDDNSAVLEHIPRIFRTSYVVRFALLVFVVYLMTVKPG